MILLDTFPAARFQLRSSPQDLLARVVKIHRCLSQLGVLLLHSAGRGNSIATVYGEEGFHAIWCRPETFAACVFFVGPLVESQFPSRYFLQYFYWVYVHPIISWIAVAPPVPAVKPA